MKLFAKLLNFNQEAMRISICRGGKFIASTIGHISINKLNYTNILKIHSLHNTMGQQKIPIKEQVVLSKLELLHIDKYTHQNTKLHDPC